MLRVSPARPPALGQLWRGRAKGELKAAATFASFASALDAHGFGALAPLARGAVADELRHVELCRALARDPGPAPTLGAVKRWSRRGLLAQAVAFGCVTETLNTALLAAALETAVDDEATGALRAILRDEVGHAKLGWAVVQSVEQAELAQLGFDVSHALVAAASAALLEADGDGRIALVAWGEPLPSARRAVVASTVRDVVLPGLAQVGLDVEPGWRWLTQFEAKDAAAVHGLRHAPR